MDVLSFILGVSTTLAVSVCILLWLTYAVPEMEFPED
jgi:hypothetical protein